MLKLKNRSIAAYKGDYRPVDILKNNQKIHGFKVLGMSGNESTFTNTYNDHISVYGKSSHIQGINLCPPPKNFEGVYRVNDITYSYALTVKENGRFDFSGAMAAGENIGKITLKPGTYTASGCSYVYLWWEKLAYFLAIPNTFTLEEETEIELCFWYTEYTNITLEDQYIQIEKGNVATEYSPFEGNPDFPPSINNYRPLVSAGGTVRCEGGNLLTKEFFDVNNWPFDTLSSNADSRVYDLDLPLGDYTITFDTDLTSDMGYMYLKSSDDDWQTSTTVRWLLMNTAANKTINFTVEEGKKYRLWIWRVERVFDKYRRWQMRRKTTPNKYYLPHDPVTLKIPDLKGIMVDSTTAYNYSESTENGDVYYVSDKLEKDKITKRIGEAVLDGSEAITKKEIDSAELACYYLDFSRHFKNNRSFDFGICNYFKRLASQGEVAQGMALGMEDKNLYLFLNKSNFPDVDAVSAWIKGRFEESKPVTIFYILDEATEELVEMENTLKSFPKFTRLLVSESEDTVSLGMAKCIKTQML